MREFADLAIGNLLGISSTNTGTQMKHMFMSQPNILVLHVERQALSRKQFSCSIERQKENLPYGAATIGISAFILPFWSCLCVPPAFLEENFVCFFKSQNRTSLFFRVK